MHLYNAWLPPQVAEETKREKESFSTVVGAVKESWRPDDPESVYSTLKWISVVQLFVNAKSEVSLGDVEALVEVGLEMFHASQNKLYAQVRWGSVLVRLLKKYGKKLSLKVQWRPFYDILMQTHFKRNTGPEGWRLRQRHFETVTSLVRSCRKFFPSGSALEIWSEFRSGLENPWHNSSFEGCGFVKLFLPMNSENEGFFTNEWIKQCIDQWDSIPNCQFWDIQWVSVIARCIRNYKTLDWEHFLPVLFTRYLNIFEVPVSSGNGSYPFSLDVPGYTKFLFSSKTGFPARAVAKSIVHLLKPGSSAQQHFEKLVNLLEQYYHPSNGGRWTYSLERFLRYLVIAFERRLQREQFTTSGNKQAEVFLGKSERSSFVKMVLKLIDRGQYSKNDSLAQTVAVSMSTLAFVEPSLVLPFIASRFHLALETSTATHQLKTALTSVAFAGRALFLASTPSYMSSSDGLDSTDTFINLLKISLSNSLLGMDVNDPPKTLATIKLVGSIISNLTELNYNEDEHVVLQSISFPVWLDEFFDRLFSLLQHLEPSSVLNDGVNMSGRADTFLLEDSSYYFCMLQILLGKLSKPLFSQLLKKISKFVNTTILPGAVAEVGLLCCACVYSNSEEAATHLIEPILKSIVSSLKENPISGFGGRGISNGSYSTKATLSPALETALEYQLKILSTAITYGGPMLLKYRDELKGAIASAFEAPSWKVYGAGDHLLRSLLGGLVLYYPIDQYKCSLQHPDAPALEEWICSKSNQDGGHQLPPKWHIPSEDELLLAEELLDLHLRSALDDLLTICQTKIHSEPGNEKEHLKVTLLRIYSSLQGVQSCLPDLRPSYNDGRSKDQDQSNFLIAGAAGLTVGSSELREKVAVDIHEACRYLLEERSDDSILLVLVIRIMDALGNYGSLEYGEWSNHVHSWKLESPAIVEPPCNFIDSSHARGKKRPRWAMIDKAYMHNLWRSSQSSYLKFRADGNVSPSEYLILLMGDLLNLSLHNYESVRLLAGKSLLKMLKRWPSLIANCVLTLTGNLRDPTSLEHVVLGSCAILTSQTILRHLTTDARALSSFLLGLLASSHHESLKAQKAISELFVKYNIHFAGISRRLLRTSDDPLEGSFAELISQISSMSFEPDGLHWRYNLMANRVLLLLTLASRSDSILSPKILGDITGHFLKSLKSQLPQSRMLAISALNALLEGSHHKSMSQEQHQSYGILKEKTNSVLEEILSQILQEEGFFRETLNSLSHVHIIADSDSSSSRSNHGSSLQSSTDKATTLFYFDFSASWPRTPSWISLLGGDYFYSKFARIFKRLIQECGAPAIMVIQNALEEFLSAKERAKQCVAAEALAGILHSDVNGLLDAWDSWVMVQLQRIIAAPSVESTPEWAACIRYVVTGKGKYGTRIPLLRQRVLDCLMTPLSQTVATSVVAKRYIFLSAALIEISPPRMPFTEVEYHDKLLKELLDNMDHSSAQVREAIGVTLAISCSNLRLYSSFTPIDGNENTSMVDASGSESWSQLLKAHASELAVNIQQYSQSENLESPVDLTHENGFTNAKLQEDVRRIETMFHFVISSLKSGRSSFLLDILLGLIYPVISLQETSHKDLSTLAKAAFELLKWRILPPPYLEDAVSVLLCSANDPNWRTRFASLTYLRSFMYRHTFLLSSTQKLQIWMSIEKLLIDNQVEVREHAAGVLASLMKGGDEDLVDNFRDRAYVEAQSIHRKRKRRDWNSYQSLASTHGAVLALAASVLSVPYDMPNWLPRHVTLLARFVSEPSPVKPTVTKAVAEFRRTHADAWIIQKDSFTEEELEVLADTSASSYFA